MQDGGTKKNRKKVIHEAKDRVPEFSFCKSIINLRIILKGEICNVLYHQVFLCEHRCSLGLRGRFLCDKDHDKVVSCSPSVHLSELPCLYLHFRHNKMDLI